MEEIKNVIVTQKDIYDLIQTFNTYFIDKEKIFNETERLVNEEEANYKQWNDARYSSNDFANYPEFKRQVFHNKRSSSSFTINTSYVDGSNIDGKSADEFIQSVSHLGFDKMEAITINMNISYYNDYKVDDYSSDPSNRVSQDVYIKFREDSIYYTVSGENCSAAVTELKSIILNKIDSLEPRLSNLITKRKKIKYRATFYRAFILSAILVCVLAVLLKKYVTIIDLYPYRYGYFAVYLLLSLFINPLVPSAKLSKLYSLIIPKQSKEYSSYDKAYHNVDNLKDFVSYPEVQIGANAKKSGVRDGIKKHIKHSKVKNIIAFILGLAGVFAVIMFIA